MTLLPESILTPVLDRNVPRPAFFLDRDDTLIPDVPYLSDPGRVELYPLAVEGLIMLRNAGYRLILLSNQSGIGRGLFTREQLKAVHARLQSLLAAQGVSLDAAYFCPHVPQESCPCRKPATGLLEAACHDFPTILEGSAMAGDKEADILLGRNAGITAIQILAPGRKRIEGADYEATDLADAAAWLLGRRKGGAR